MILALGLLAGTLTTAAWLPQLIKTWRLGRADEVSGLYLFTFGTGVLGWLVYGIASRQPAVLVTNAVTLLLVGSLIVIKLRQDTSLALTEVGHDEAQTDVEGGESAEVAIAGVPVAAAQIR